MNVYFFFNFHGIQITKSLIFVSVKDIKNVDFENVNGRGGGKVLTTHDRINANGLRL